MPNNFQKSPINKIILVIEVYSRDLPGRLEIARKLRSSGNNIYLIEQELLRRLPPRFINGSLIYDKSLSNSKTRLSFYKKIKKLGGQILIEDEEANVVFSDSGRYITARTNLNVLNQVDYVMCWNTEQIDQLSNTYKQHRHKFILTGSSKYSTFARSMKKNQPLISKRILIPSNFSLLTNYHDANHYIRFREKLEISGSVSQITYHSLWDQTTSQIQDIYKLSQTKDIDIRPHPSDDITRLKRLFSDYKTIRVLKPAPLIDDLQNYTEMYHFNCNSAIEAQIYGLKTINLAKNPQQYLSQPYQDIVGSEAVKKIVEFIDQNFALNHGTPGHQNLRAYTFLLKIEYSLRKLLGRNVAKNVSKKNSEFLTTLLKEELRDFLIRGHQVINHET